MASTVNERVWYIFGIDMVIIESYPFIAMEKKKEELAVYNLRMPPALKKRLEKKAKDERRSLNSYLILELEKLATATV